MSAPLGILGGTFDPVHNAHLRIGARALEALALGRVRWMPTGAPGYRDAPVASGAHRLAMLRCALEDEPRWEIDARELEPGHSGYTVDTLRVLRAELGADPAMVLLLGADQYAKLASWHRAPELFSLARVAVFARPGWQAPQAVRDLGPAEHVEFAAIDVSGSGIRTRLAAGADVSGMIPARVLEYIRRHGLYR